jgi:hypothetical protein
MIRRQSYETEGLISEKISPFFEVSDAAQTSEVKSDVYAG